MKRLLLTLLAGAALAAPVAASAGAGGSLGISEAAGARFPDRIYRLELPRKMKLSADRLTVTENGQPVADVQVVSAEEAASGEFGVVLAIDASNSMRGAAITGAMNAARAFLAQRSSNEQVAVIAFNRQTTTILSFNSDTQAIVGALSTPPSLAEGTHLYDAVQGSLDLLQKSKIKAGSIVILSDGADTGSRARSADAAAAARRAHVRVFTVGLRSRQFSPRSLRELAQTTDGRYAEATKAAGLTQIYRNLGERLSREYLLHYKSLAAPGKTIHVSVAVNGLKGATVTTGYVTPALALNPAPPYRPAALDRFLQSPGAAVLISIATAGLISLGLTLILRPRGRGLRRRMSEFVSLSHLSDRDGVRGGLTDRVFVGAERSLEHTRWWAHFKEEVELSGIRLPPVQIVLWALVGAVALGWVLVELTGVALFGVLGLTSFLVAWELVERRVARVRRLFADQLPDNLQVLASALRAGHSLVGAMSVVVDDAPEPTRSEFRRVIADERLGVPFEDALEVVVRRMQSKELAQVALVAALQRQTGGNSAEVLDRVVELIRERAELRRLVRTLTSQGRMSRWILTGLPLCLMGAILLIAPNYLHPLFTTGTGRVLLVISAIMVAAGSYAIRRIIDIKV